MSDVVDGPPAEAEDRLGLIALAAEASPDGILIVGPNGDIRARNSRFAEIWGFGDDLLATASDDAALAEAMNRVADPDAFIGRVRELSETRATSRDEIALRDGRVLDRYGTPLHDSGGADIGYAWYFRDISEQRQTEIELRDLATTLQATLLPPVRPHVPGMDIGTRYRAADRVIGVGGDFLDVFRVGTNAWGLSIGDVCGRGGPAAALAALSRHSVRAAAVHHALPTVVLGEVNEALLSEPELGERFTSVVFARLELDLCGAWVTLCSAGHPRPIVVRTAGWVDLRGQPGTLLGLFPDPTLGNDRVGLGPGDSLVFCTDGITEARRPGSTEEFGDEELARVLLDTAGRSADEIAGAVMDAVLAYADDVNDDMAVLVVTVPPDAKDDPEGRIERATGVPFDEAVIPRYPLSSPSEGLPDAKPLPPREARAVFGCAPAEVRRARDFVASAVRSWRMPEVASSELALLTSELATNAVLHARTEFTIVVRYSGPSIRVEVGDGSRSAPQRRETVEEDTSGRGLNLVEMLAADWGVLETLNGKRVWFEMPASPEQPG